MAMRWQSSALVLPALLLGACLVQDVELVDRLPGASGGSGGDDAGASGGMAGSSNSSGSQNEGGDPSSGAAGGDDSGGGAGASSGGSPPGGSAGAGAGGSGGSGPGTISEIPQNLLDCGSVSNPYVCDDFETQLSPQWPPGTTPANVVDAPSGKLGLAVNFNETHELPVDLTAMSISFWVRFPSPTDQRFLSFRDETTLQEFGIGIEHERARWIYADMTSPAVAPEMNSLTRTLGVNTWVCVQLRVDLFTSTFDASVVVPGDAPVVLPVLDKTATAGHDDLWNKNFPNWTANSGSIIFGQLGVSQEFDDVLVADYDTETLCEKFAALGPD